MSIDDELKNGVVLPPEIDPKSAFQANPQLVAMLEQVLNDVKAGRITSVATLCVAPNGQVQWPGMGMQLAEMYVGASLFQRSLEKIMTGEQRGGGRILRPGH